MSHDDTLAIRAKTDQQAFTDLAEAFAGMLSFIARNRFAPGVGRDDLDQAALLGLWNAVLNFDSRKGHFAPLAKLCIQRMVDTAVKAALRGKHGPLNDAVRSVPDPDGDEGELDAVDFAYDPRLDPVEVLIARERFAIALRVVTQELSPLERAVAVGQLNDETYIETAQRLGLAETTNQRGYPRCKPVDNALGRVKRKLGEALGEAA